MTKTADWSRLAASAPVNKAAALATSARGEAPVELVHKDSLVSRTPLPLQRVREGETDLTGAVFGRLTVVGLADRKQIGLSAGRGGRWVARCKCGLYQPFTAKGLRALDQDGRAMCSVCDATKRMIAGYGTAGTVRFKPGIAEGGEP